MNIKKWIKVTLILACIVTLAGCWNKRRVSDQAAINNANAAYGQAGARTSGYAQGPGFGDRNYGGRYASKKVYYFPFDSSVVHEEDKQAIASNASYLRANPRSKIMLEGHTDPRGSREYNIGLGERRGKAVAQILAEKGVNPSRVRIVSYGSQKLAAPGHSEEDYQQDRRAALVYTQR